ncbi:3-hydroxy-9,10-secoandrosta-1,3,5(10)-triene-9,17-dione monooxygenase reductase component [Virgibacillus halotolerans]|uniref:flavin reductase family protein n=1 Tax=Virgibacillus halotolerans TaxID=1071053 RepID=UPI00195F5BAE|nr:flavin reductase family protein [Virgibacillus halotolerans]MBM7599221.1 3-hydroxy-9,10-secoandrosta-1,3,5(10)-triene-9,17-dione monooxygenase reductase component [Virgibacillus halotolerans]
MNPKEFRNTMGNFATGVTVITTSKGEELIGMTANSFSSLSVDPPLILVCIDKKSTSMRAFSRDHPFAVNILQEEQEEACSGFAKKGGNKFERASYYLSETGVPVLENNMATIECTVYDILEGGDHYIITGYVQNVSYNNEKKPLLFFRGKFGSIFEDITIAAK